MKRLAILFFCIFFLCSGIAAQDFAKADSLIGVSISDGIVPGAVACVVRDGEVICLKAYGNMQTEPTHGQEGIADLPKSMRTDALFDMASCTKVVVTTTAILQLYEQGLVELDAPVGKYLWEFRDQPVTVTDLLTHTSGFAWSWGRYFKDVCGSKLEDNTTENLTLWLADPNNRRPRATQFNYCCANFFLLQLMIERITGERLCDYSRTHIFKPLGMNDSYFFLRDEQYPEGVYERICAGKTTKETGRVDDGFARIALGGNAGNAGLFSTAGDLAKFCTAIMYGGANRNGRILKPETIEMMSKVVDPRFGRALGWDVSSTRKSLLKGYAVSPDAVVHGGHTGTMIAIDIAGHYAIILLANRNHPNDLYYNEWLERRIPITTALGYKTGEDSGLPR